MANDEIPSQVTKYTRRGRVDPVLSDKDIQDLVHGHPTAEFSPMTTARKVAAWREPWERLTKRFRPYHYEDVVVTRGLGAQKPRSTLIWGANAGPTENKDGNKQFDPNAEVLSRVDVNQSNLHGTPYAYGYHSHLHTHTETSSEKTGATQGAALGDGNGISPLQNKLRTAAGVAGAGALVGIALNGVPNRAPTGEDVQSTTASAPAVQNANIVADGPISQVQKLLPGEQNIGPNQLTRDTTYLLITADNVPGLETTLQTPAREEGKPGKVVGLAFSPDVFERYEIRAVSRPNAHLRAHGATGAADTEFTFIDRQTGQEVGHVISVGQGRNPQQQGKEPHGIEPLIVLGNSGKTIVGQANLSGAVTTGEINDSLQSLDAQTQTAIAGAGAERAPDFDQNVGTGLGVTLRGIGQGIGGR